MVSLSAPALAATGDGRFAIKGLAARACSEMVREFEGSTPNTPMYGGWIYGYLTAMNQTTPDTFDLAPWQDLETLTNYVIVYCRGNPTVTFGQAVFRMSDALRPARLASPSSLVSISLRGKTYLMYEAVLERLIEALEKGGFLKASLRPKPAAFTPDVARALRVFQAKHKLEQTGLPDQRTLHELFIEPRKPR